MNNKGFTLVELLAVLIILAIILVITVPNVIKTINKSEIKSFVNSVDLAINATESYINDPDNNFTLPESGKGKLLSVSTLVDANLIKNATGIKTGGIVVYNNVGVYQLYAFVSNGNYEIVGYQADDLLDNVKSAATFIQYGGYLGGISNYYLNLNDPQLKFTPSTNFGGTDTDLLYSIEKAGTGYIAVGYSESTDSDLAGLSKDEYNGATDATIVKYDDSMNIVWTKTFGGTYADYYYDVISVSDGYVAVGSTKSRDYDCADLNIDNGWFAADSIIVKYDLSGNVVWKKSYFSSILTDVFYAVKSTTDGYIAAGYNGLSDVTYDSYNGSLVKYDLNGNMVWEKTFGGTASDYFKDVEVVSDGYVAVGYSNSTDVDMAGSTLSGNNAIMVKYDLNGNFLWKKIFGGGSGDYFSSIVYSEGNYYIGGYSYSTDNDLSGYHYGTTSSDDAILMKVDASGNKVWVRNFGGTAMDQFSGISVSSSKIIASGYSMSNDNDVSGYHNGTTDYADGIIAVYDASGNLTYKKNVGGTAEDYINQTIWYGSSYYTTGYSRSNDNDFFNLNKGVDDGFISKITP